MTKAKPVYLSLDGREFLKLRADPDDEEWDQWNAWRAAERQPSSEEEEQVVLAVDRDPRDGETPQ